MLLFNLWLDHIDKPPFFQNINFFSSYFRTQLKPGFKLNNIFCSPEYSCEPVKGKNINGVIQEDHSLLKFCTQA